MGTFTRQTLYRALSLVQAGTYRAKAHHNKKANFSLTNCSPAV